MKKILLAFSAFYTLVSYGQGTYYNVVTVQENHGATINDYPALLDVNTQALITAGEMNVDGSDIRFTNMCGDMNYDYYIESGINTANTLIWVRIPVLNASSTEDVKMWYGDTTAVAVSNFNATFPNAIITSGDTTITGTIYPGWFQVNAGHNVTLAAGTPVEIYAGHVQIDGNILGDGAGDQTPAGTFTAGNGTGGGLPSQGSSGSGGGAYGGNGGLGGYDAGDNPGPGGTAFGTNNMMTISMGSSGATGATTSGAGNGGGALTLFSERVSITGTVNVNGTIGSSAGQSCGGGSGGGFLCIADAVDASGTINANGGDGGPGTITANDSGGGGGGGRIKFFHDASYTAGTTSVLGGIGGPYGNAAGGEDGLPGTVYDEAWSYVNPTIGTQFSFLSSSTQSICAGDSIMISGIYQSTAGVYGDTLQDMMGCDSLINQVTLTIDPLPVVDLGGDTTICDTVVLVLDAGPGVSYTWSPSGNTGQTENVSSAGTYSVDVTDVNGCVGSGSVVVTVDICSIGISENETVNMTVYPNPTADFVSLSFDKLSDEISLFMTDINGRIVWSQSNVVNTQLSVDMTSFESGIYFIHISNGKNSNSVKVVKQ